MLRQNLFLHVFFSILLFGVLVSCVKKEPNLIEDNHTFNVHFSLQKPSGSDLGKIADAAKRTLSKNSLWASTGSMAVNQNEGFLYFWSFNKESLVPDIFIHKDAEIRVNGQEPPNPYPNDGFRLDPFTAGKAFSIRALEDAVIVFPLENVTSLRDFGFDISSSGTGPKAFHVLYSLDHGMSYDTLSAHNHFMDLGNQKLNRYSFEMDTISWNSDQSLYVKIEVLAGDRSDIGEYKPTGVTRFDNIYLSGTGDFPIVGTEPTLYYWLFDYASGNPVFQDSLLLRGGVSSLDLSLKKGKYIAHFVSNFSSVPLLSDKGALKSQDHFIGRLFLDGHTEIFGSVDTITIQEDRSFPIALKRYYSQVTFELTDPLGLEEVDKIRVTSLHDPYFYAPFASSMSNPIQDQSEVVLDPDFNEDSRTFSFHQFIGNVSQPQNLRYQIEVFTNQDELLHSFEVQGNSRNNAKLIFRGKLLDYTEGSFPFVLEEEWDEEDEVLF